MLDVHPPEHAPHGVREFFLHLFTITIGLLIALGLENAAEAWHHRQQKREAETMIRQEIQENRANVLQQETTIHTEMQDLVGVLNYIDARLARHPIGAKQISVSFSEGPLQDAAWRTAAATGVVAYMDYATAEQYAACYKEQALFEQGEERALEAYLNIESFMATTRPDQLSDEDLKQAQPVVRSALADLGGLRDVGNGTIRTYDAALK